MIVSYCNQPAKKRTAALIAVLLPSDRLGLKVCTAFAEIWFQWVITTL